MYFNRCSVILLISNVINIKKKRENQQIFKKCYIIPKYLQTPCSFLMYNITINYNEKCSR